MTPKTTAFGQFILSIKKETGLSDDEIRKVLREAGHKSFDPIKTHLYRAALAGYCIAKEEKKAPPVIMKSDPCPIQNCTGYKDRSNRYWPWTCTVGGLRHHLIARASERTGIPHQEFIRRMDDIQSKINEQEECSEESTEPRGQPSSAKN